MKLPAQLPPESVVALVDSREQTPWDLSPLRSEPASLPTGDYSVRGLEHLVAVERKSLPDLLGCIGRERERFDREIDRLRAYPVRAIIIEASWDDLEGGQWRGSVTPASAVGSVLGWVASGVPCILAGTRQRAERHAARFLYLAARREWRKLRALAGAIEAEPKTRKSRNAPRGPATAFCLIPEDEAK